VTAETGVGKDRADVAVETDRVLAFGSDFSVEGHDHCGQR